MRIIRAISVAMLLLAVARPAAADWTIGAFLGGSWTRDTSLTLTRPASGLDVTLDPIHYAGEPWKSPQYFGYRVGYLPGSHHRKCAVFRCLRRLSPPWMKAEKHAETRRRKQG